jgi:hypothetical protein
MNYGRKKFLLLPKLFVFLFPSVYLLYLYLSRRLPSSPSPRRALNRFFGDQLKKLRIFLWSQLLVNARNFYMAVTSKKSYAFFMVVIAVQC